MKAALSTQRQIDAWSSPWSWQHRARRALWLATWTLLCRWTPKPFNPWRILILKLFGASVQGAPFVHGSARIYLPRNLSLKDRSCIGERAIIYSLAPIEICAHATVSIEAFLCTGTHDFSQAHIPVQTAPITIGAHAFIAARAFLLPGVEIGEEAVIGACTVVTQNVPRGCIVAGNPARVIGQRSVN